MTDGNTDSNWLPEMDEAEHESTYEGFVALTKYGVIAMVVLLILGAIFLV